MKQRSSNQGRSASYRSLASRIALVILLSTVSAVLSHAEVIYNSIPKKLPGNEFSVAFEGAGVSEFGDIIAFKPGNRGNLVSVKVILSSWACQIGNASSGNCVTHPGRAIFTHPITLNIYKVSSQSLMPGGPPGTLLATITQKFNIPYRPSADSRCTGTNAGKWYDSQDKACYNGIATPIVFDQVNPPTTLPDTVIFGIAYNTSLYGSTPIGKSPSCYSTLAGCPYDSLNVSAEGNGGLTGKVLDQNGIFLNISYSDPKCPIPVLGQFRLDTSSVYGCSWLDYHPQIQFIDKNGENNSDGSEKDAFKDSASSDNGRDRGRSNRLSDK